MLHPKNSPSKVIQLARVGGKIVGSGGSKPGRQEHPAGPVGPGSWPPRRSKSRKFYAEEFASLRAEVKWELSGNPEISSLAISTQLSIYRKLLSSLEILCGIKMALEFCICA